MERLATEIVSIIKDYHNYLGFQFTSGKVMVWVSQFDDNDRKFILEEFLYLLQKGIYISEEKGRTLLISRMEHLANVYKFEDPITFFSHVDILRLQQQGKSQDVLLKLLDDEVQRKYGLGLAHFGTASKKYPIYFDDILATGGTVYNDLSKWLPLINSDGISNLEKLVNGNFIFSIALFCNHNGNTTLWRLKEGFGKNELLKRIRIFSNYEIENHLSFYNQKLNFAYPVANQPEEVIKYFEALPLTAHKNAGKAFRIESVPTKEALFSSANNRIRFENILLKKGIELLGKAESLKPNHRPLGATFPSYRTLGTGTLFFTWRNISNTTPVVFWWKAGGWQPLFPLYHRGLAI
jgi:hypothetical protein